MQKPISADEVGRAAASPAATPIRITIVTLDSHMASTVERARAILRRELPGLSLSLHAVTEWAGDEDAMARAREDIAAADIVIANETEFARLSGRPAETLALARDEVEALHARTGQCLIVTLGGDGVLWARDGQVEHVESLKIKPVDTVGAGDTFCGALAARRCRYRQRPAGGGGAVG